jgi:hypothetical protein
VEHQLNLEFIYINIREINRSTNIGLRRREQREGCINQEAMHSAHNFVPVLAGRHSGMGFVRNQAQRMHEKQPKAAVALDCQKGIPGSSWYRMGRGTDLI